MRTFTIFSPNYRIQMTESLFSTSEAKIVAADPAGLPLSSAKPSRRTLLSCTLPNDMISDVG